MADHDYSSGVRQYIARGLEQNEAASAARQRMRQMKFDTIAVHGLYDMEAARLNQGSINEPLYLSSAQHFESSDHMEAALAYLTPAWAYTRIANPTLTYLEETLALLEGYGYSGDVSACAVASGMAALFLATNPLLKQDKTGRKFNLVASSRCYGGTFMLFSERYAAERGIEVRWVREPLDLEEWKSNIDDGTRFVFAEMPSNPTLTVCDIEALADLAHAVNAPLMVDSTVATPALLRPLCLGADIVVHSLSKSMNTGGLAIAGAIIARHNLPAKVGPPELRENFAGYLKLLPGRDFGPALSPFSALMILNDLHTLRGKMDALSRSTLQVARFLHDHPRIDRVYYPGLAGDPGHALASRCMWLADGEDDYGEPVNRYGHLLSFTVAGGAGEARTMFDRLRMIWRATDLGRIKSIATIPSISTHQQQGDQGRDLAGIPANLVRLNVGGEHPGDIIADLDQALGKEGPPASL